MAHSFGTSSFGPIRSAFDPERWQRQGEENSRAYHPFGAGPRVYIGNHFSMLESHLLLAILAQHFTPRLRAGYEPMWDHQGLLSLKHGVPMIIAARVAHAQQ